MGDYDMIKMLYTGDSGIVLGPIAFETPFIMEIKDAYLREWGHYLINALKNNPNISITYIPSIQAYRSFPKNYDELKQYDIIMLSDLSAEVLMFFPEFFPLEQLRETSILSSTDFVGMPNRLKLIKRFVEEGGGFIMAGGWFSFSGRFGNGAWYRTPIAEILPVHISEVDDRVETPDGAFVKAIDTNHPIMRNIDWSTCPPFLGYNKVKVKKNAKLLAIIGEDEDPFIVVGRYGQGKVMAFTSDPVLHWGINFVKWKYYSMFWTQVLEWFVEK